MERLANRRGATAKRVGTPGRTTRAKRSTGSIAAASRRRVAAAGREETRGEPISLRDRKKQRTWESIATATVELVVELGFDAVRVEDVCARAEVGRSTFFRYFDSREAAFVAGIHQGRLGSVVAAIERRPEVEDALTALTNAFLEVYSDWREQRELMQLEAGIRAVSVQVKVRSLGQPRARSAPRSARSPAGGDDRLRRAHGQRSMARGRRSPIAGEGADGGARSRARALRRQRARRAPPRQPYELTNRRLVRP
jgi:AcrR family transcriptional regulator